MTYDGRGFVRFEFLQVQVLDEICDEGRRRGERKNRVGDVSPLRTGDVVAYARARERAGKRALKNI